MVHVDFSMFLDRSNVFERLDRRNKTLLLRTGGFTRTAMKNQMKRAPKKKTIQRAIDDDGAEVLIDNAGRMHRRDGTYLPASHADKIVQAQRVHNNSKPGEPPYAREGSLKRLIYFGFDPAGPSVVVGPMRFATRTRPGGGKSVPELLNEGGVAKLAMPGGETVSATFKPRPFTPRPLAAGAEFLARETEKVPL